jgi:hypothetical protein
MTIQKFFGMALAVGFVMALLFSIGVIPAAAQGTVSAKAMVRSLFGRNVM